MAGTHIRHVRSKKGVKAYVVKNPTREGGGRREKRRSTVERDQPSAMPSSRIPGGFNDEPDELTNADLARQAGADLRRAGVPTPVGPGWPEQQRLQRAQERADRTAKEAFATGDPKAIRRAQRAANALERAGGDADRAEYSPTRSADPSDRLTGEKITADEAFKRAGRRRRQASNKNLKTGAMTQGGTTQAQRKFTSREPTAYERGHGASQTSTVKVWERADGTKIKKTKPMQLIYDRTMPSIVVGRRSAGPATFQVTMPDGTKYEASTLAEAKQKIRSHSGRSTNQQSLADMMGIGTDPEGNLTHRGKKPNVSKPRQRRKLTEEDKQIRRDRQRERRRRNKG